VFFRTHFQNRSAPAFLVEGFLEDRKETRRKRPRAVSRVSSGAIAWSAAVREPGSFSRRIIREINEQLPLS
jgi:hypothetical protein